MYTYTVRNIHTHTVLTVYVVKIYIYIYIIFSRESKYEIRVQRVVASEKKYLYTVPEKMRFPKLNLAKKG